MRPIPYDHVEILAAAREWSGKKERDMVDGKVIIVTGGASGIGKASCQILAQGGAKVVVADFDLDGAIAVAASLAADGHAAVATQVDVRDEGSVEAMVAFSVNMFGRLDGAHDNAGISTSNKLVEDLDDADWKPVMAVNFTGILYSLKHQIRAMRTTGGGAIVVTASAASLVGNPYSTDYVAAKHGALGLVRGASTEAAITGVRVNAILPGMIMTPMVEGLVGNPDFKTHYDAALARHTIGRFGQPEDVAYVARFLLSDQSAFMNGSAVLVDGGYTAR